MKNFSLTINNNFIFASFLKSLVVTLVIIVIFINFCAFIGETPMQFLQAIGVSSII